MKIERSSKASITPQGKPSLPRSSKALIAKIVCRDRAKHRADRDLAFASIAMAQSVNCKRANHRSRSREAPRRSRSRLRADRNRRGASHDCSPSSNPKNVCVSVFDWNIFVTVFVCVSVVWQLRNVRKCDQIWWFFFWVLFMFLYWGMNDIIYSFGTRENVSNK